MVLSTTVNTWSNKILDATNKRIYPYVSGSSVTNGMTTYTTTTISTPDSYGNITGITKAFANGVTETTANTITNTVNSTDWKLGRLDNSTVTYSKTGETSVSQTVRYTYSTDGIMKPDYIYYYEGTSLAYTKNHDYDSKGNLTQVTTSGTSVGTSSVSSTYDTNGIRVLTSTDALGHTITNTYNTYGLLYTQTDYLSNCNTYGYDALGRQTSVSRTDGSQNGTSYIWTGTNKPSWGVYGINQTGNDGSGTIFWYNRIGQLIRTEKIGFSGTKILTDTEYLVNGLVYRVSDPYFAGESCVWAETNAYSYDILTDITRNTGRNTHYAYNGARVTETETRTATNQTKWRQTDGQGLVTAAYDDGGNITYTYYPDGNIKTITAPGSAVTSFQYGDAARNKTQMIDPSTGTTNYTYDSFGRVKTQTNSRNQVTTYTYLADGRTDNYTNAEGTTTCSYNTNKQLTGISSPNSVSRTYGYDSKGRVSSIAENIAGSNFSTSFTYDNIGRLSTRTHPSGIVETTHYNSYGYFFYVSAGGAVRYTVGNMNARLQVTGAEYGTNLMASYGFDAYGYPSSTSATSNGTKQDYRYTFNPVTGNLSSRQNYLRSLTENFTSYDNLDQLITVSGPQNLTMAYNSNGNITTKSDIGTGFTYGNNAGPYAMTGVTSSTGVIPTATQTATYTSSEKVNTISEDVYSASFLYNADQQRAKMTVTQSGNTILTRYYVGSRYIKETTGAGTEYTFIGGDAYTAPAVAVKVHGLTHYYSLLRDYLGNVTHEVDTTNTVVAEYSFDAWGRRRNPSDWGYNLSGQPDLVADRGFTGHEYLKYFNVYNMNGRMYDPLVGRFLSADNNIQDEYSTQQYNRYSYCLNNPLRYTDPSGWLMARADEGWDLGHSPTNMVDFSIGNYYGEAIQDGWGGHSGPGIGGAGGHGNYGTMGSGYYDVGPHTTEDLMGSLWNATPDNSAYGFTNVNGNWYHTSTTFVMPYEISNATNGWDGNLLAGFVGLGINVGNGGGRPVSLTVGGNPIGQAVTWSYPYNNGNLYTIPTYPLTVNGTDASGNSISKTFEVIRFGVHGAPDGSVSMVGLADQQSYTINGWDPSYKVHSYVSQEDGAWHVMGNYLIHDGPDNPMTQFYATAGCIEVCGGPNGFVTFNNFLLGLSGANSFSQLGSSGMMNITYQTAARPPIRLYNP